jgi:hypothetical protein
VHGMHTRKTPAAEDRKLLVVAGTRATHACAQQPPLPQQRLPQPSCLQPKKSSKKAPGTAHGCCCTTQHIAGALCRVHARHKRHTQAARLGARLLCPAAATHRSGTPYQTQVSAHVDCLRKVLCQTPALPDQSGVLGHPHASSCWRSSPTRQLAQSRQLVSSDSRAGVARVLVRCVCGSHARRWSYRVERAAMQCACCEPACLMPKARSTGKMVQNRTANQKGTNVDALQLPLENIGGQSQMLLPYAGGVLSRHRAWRAGPLGWGAVSHCTAAPADAPQQCLQNLVLLLVRASIATKHTTVPERPAGRTGGAQCTNLLSPPPSGESTGQECALAQNRPVTAGDGNASTCIVRLADDTT